jgi:hypothetical protein
VADSRFDPVALLKVLRGSRVRFVLIGGMAGSTHGSATVTGDLDILFARDRVNLEALTRALKRLGAKPRGQDHTLPFALDAQLLLNGTNFTWETRLGDLDTLGEVSGGFTFDRVAQGAVTYDFEGSKILVSSLDDLIAMKRAAGRPADLLEVERLSALRDVHDRKTRR